MERTQLHSQLEARLQDCWDVYKDELLALPPDQIIARADEISAARFCYDALTENSNSYPDHLLENLLKSDNPLEAIREQWQNEQCVDLSGELEHALWSLWDHGPQQRNSPAMGGMN